MNNFFAIARKLAVAGALTFALAAAGMAQTSATGVPAGTTANVPQTNKGLGLTDDQKSQIKAIHQNDKQQIQAIKNDSSLSREQKKERFRDIRQNGNAQINALLTPEQQKKFKQAKHRRHARRKELGQRKNSFR
jgi:Spy/CpxP family protein refolding chaperone